MEALSSSVFSSKLIGSETYNQSCLSKPLIKQRNGFLKINEISDTKQQFSGGRLDLLSSSHSHKGVSSKSGLVFSVNNAFNHEVSGDDDDDKNDELILIPEAHSSWFEDTSSNHGKSKEGPEASNLVTPLTVSSAGGSSGGSRAGLFRTPISGGVQSATSAHGLPRPALAVRNLMEQARFAHLCTVMSRMHHRREGYPFGSLVDFAPDPMGHPIFSFSPLAIHTRNLLADPRCTLVVQIPGWSGLSNARVTIFGDVYPLAEDQQTMGCNGMNVFPCHCYLGASGIFMLPQGLRFCYWLALSRALTFKSGAAPALGTRGPVTTQRDPYSSHEWAHKQYVAKHQQVASQQWGNFHYFRMQNIRVAKCIFFLLLGLTSDIYFIGGFGTVAWVDVKEYETLQPDKIAINGGEQNLKELNALFSKPLKELLSAEAEIDDAALISIDSKGTDIRVRQGAQFNIQRISFDVGYAVETLEEAKAALQKLINKDCMLRLHIKG
ncbi:hypothetical protein C5167_015604 [Papaver somniferum]|uniref:Uncharacterized protein n=1 Tax=Papaver somniferum TaxID=3469 RepID=A0A4Y7JAV1_PAPSO|nr:hypothetical protein C5167_015604 [Papaver somniferum]